MDVSGLPPIQAAIRVRGRDYAVECFFWKIIVLKLGEPYGKARASCLGDVFLESAPPRLDERLGGVKEHELNAVHLKAASRWLRGGASVIYTDSAVVALSWR